MPLLILNLGCENVKYPARKHFEKTNRHSGRRFTRGIRPVKLTKVRKKKFLVTNQTVDFVNIQDGKKTKKNKKNKKKQQLRMKSLSRRNTFFHELTG